METKKLILDYSKWRSGFNGKNKVGEGDTCLLNDEGFMCCLGQFSPQINTSIKLEDMKGWGSPNELNIEIDFLSVPSTDDDGEKIFLDTNLTQQAIGINDDQTTTPQEKINLLKELFLGVGFTIEVINQP